MVSGLSRKVSAWENFFSGEYLQIFYILAVPTRIATFYITRIAIFYTSCSYILPLTPWKTNFATDIVELH